MLLTLLHNLGHGAIDVHLATVEDIRDVPSATASST